MAVFGLLCLWLLPLFMSIGRFIALKIVPLLAQRVKMELSVAGIAGVMIVFQVIGIGAAIWVQRHLEEFYTVPATLVFTVYAIIPGVSMCMAVRSMVQGYHEAWFFSLLGLYNLGGGYLRWASDLKDDAQLEKAEVPLEARAQISVTWMRQVLWIFLVLDFVFEEILGHVCQIHGMSLLGPPRGEGDTTLLEYRSIAFAVGLLAAWAQERMLDLLKQRGVLLHLLGARKTMYSALSLLLMGAFAVVRGDNSGSSIGFLESVSPAPWWCCVLLWIRRFGGYIGVVLPIVTVTLQSRTGALSTDNLVTLSMSVGIGLGCVGQFTFNTLWLEKKADLESDYRVLYLFPHMSSQARTKAGSAMRIALKRGAEGTTNLAVEWAATRVFRSVLGYGANMLTGGTASKA